MTLDSLLEGVSDMPDERIIEPEEVTEAAEAAALWLVGLMSSHKQQVAAIRFTYYALIDWFVAELSGEDAIHAVEVHLYPGQLSQELKPLAKVAGLKASTISGFPQGVLKVTAGSVCFYETRDGDPRAKEVIWEHQS